MSSATFLAYNVGDTPSFLSHSILADNMRTHQSRLDRKVLGTRRARKGLGSRLEAVKDSGAVWRNQKVEQVVKMSGKKTRLLNVLVTRLLINGRRISPMVVELLNIVGGESAAQTLSQIHARTECLSVSSGPVAPNLDPWQSKLLSCIAASEDLGSGLVNGLETLARLIVAKQVSLVEKLSLDRVRAELEELVGDVSGGMEADVSVVARDINTVGSMDQNGDTPPFAPEESNGDALLGFDAPRSVG